MAGKRSERMYYFLVCIGAGWSREGLQEAEIEQEWQTNGTRQRKCLLVIFAMRCLCWAEMHQTEGRTVLMVHSTALGFFGHRQLSKKKKTSLTWIQQVGMPSLDKRLAAQCSIEWAREAKSAHAQEYLVAGSQILIFLSYVTIHQSQAGSIDVRAPLPGCWV